ncbi:MAG: LysR family transcriptional regulator [Pseudomonadota bacterium]
MRALTDLRKLRHVIGVAEAQSFTGAAQALAITQSALTKSVAEVEGIVGMALFERLPRGVRLTEAGQRFVPRARQLLADSQELLAEMNQLQSLASGLLRIGITPAAFVSFLESTVSAFAQVYPGVRVQVVHGSAESIIQQVAVGDLDLVVGAVNMIGPLRTHALTDLRLSVIAGKHHPLAQDAAPTPAQLLSYPLVMPAGGLNVDAQLLQAYRDAGLTPGPPQYVCDHFPLVRALLNVTNAVSPVVTFGAPEGRFGDAFHIFENVLQLPPPQLGIGTSPQREPSPAMRAFIDIFRSFLRDAAA